MQSFFFPTSGHERPFTLDPSCCIHDDMAQNFVPANTNALELKNEQCEIAFSLLIQVGEFMVTSHKLCTSRHKRNRTKRFGRHRIHPEAEFLGLSGQKKRVGEAPAPPQPRASDAICSVWQSELQGLGQAASPRLIILMCGFHEFAAVVSCTALSCERRR